MANVCNPNRIPHSSTSQQENTMLRLMENGPLKNVGNLFAGVLTVPPELRQKMFYWPEEREFCEHISSVGRALDTLMAVQKRFLGQFKVLTNLRATFIQAPTEFFVAPTYFCDRALDSLLRSTRKVQNDINGLFKDLAQLQDECSWRYRWTKKAFLEDKYPKDAAARKESTRRPDMEIKEQRVSLLGELVERITMVRRGGTDVFSLLGRQWLPGYVHETARHRTEDVVNIASRANNTRQEDPSINKGQGSGELEIEGSESLATPVPQCRPNIDSRLAKDVEIPVEVPETPENQRTGGLVETQRSSPRKRKPSQASDRSEATDSGKNVQFVTRRLLGDGPAELQGSPAQQSMASIEAIRAVAQRDNDVPTTHNESQDGKTQTVNQIELRSRQAACASNKPGPRKEPPPDARTALPGTSRDHEKLDGERLHSLSIRRADSD